MTHGKPTSPYWLQELVAAAGKLGISKGELFNDYYPDEICHVFRRRFGVSEDVDTEKNVGAEEFFL